MIVPKFKIIDKVLYRIEFKKLQKEVFSPEFPWYFTKTASLEDSNYSWSHVIFRHGRSVSNSSKLIRPIVERVLRRAEEPFSKILRIRLGLHTIGNKLIVDQPHVDSKSLHKVGIFYLNDTDGDTILYNETYDIDSKKDIIDYFKEKLNNKVSVMTRCTPTENRLFLFNGNQYHSSSNPILNERRVIININYE